MNFETEFEISKDDCKEIVNYHFYRRPLQMALNIVRLIFGIAAGVCAILTAIAGDGVWAVIFGTVCLVILGVFILAPKRAVSSLLKTPYYQGKIRFVGDDSGTQFIYRTGDSNTQWSGYVRYRETKHLFLLFVSDSGFRAIPKRALPAEQASQFRNLLNQRIPSSNKR
jgi:hypothetical protein